MCDPQPVVSVSFPLGITVACRRSNSDGDRRLMRIINTSTATFTIYYHRRPGSGPSVHRKK
jgi:hypothetical protein